MLIFSDIEILEHWFQMNSLDDDGSSIFTENFVNAIAFILGHSEILSSCKSGVINGNWMNWSSWIFLNSVSGESTVDGMAESLVVNEEFWIVGSIFFSHLVEFFFSEVEIEHR